MSTAQIVAIQNRKDIKELLKAYRGGNSSFFLLFFFFILFFFFARGGSGGSHHHFSGSALPFGAPLFRASPFRPPHLEKNRTEKFKKFLHIVQVKGGGENEIERWRRGQRRGEERWRLNLSD